MLTASRTTNQNSGITTRLPHYFSIVLYPSSSLFQYLSSFISNTIHANKAFWGEREGERENYMVWFATLLQSLYTPLFSLLCVCILINQSGFICYSLMWYQAGRPSFTVKLDVHPGHQDRKPPRSQRSQLTPLRHPPVDREKL